MAFKALLSLVSIVAAIQGASGTLLGFLVRCSYTDAPVI